MCSQYAARYATYVTQAPAAYCEPAFMEETIIIKYSFECECIVQFKGQSVIYLKGP